MKNDMEDHMGQYELSTQRELFKILEEAIAREDKDQATYTEAANHTDDPGARKLLLELAEMEHQHHILLETKLNEMKAVAEIQDEINEAYG